MILDVKKIFPDTNIIVAADGAFAGKELLSWAIKNNIYLELRMHSNRKVKYKGKSVVLRNISKLIPKGRYMARTIEALWHGMKLYITAQRRINKHGEETIVYQAATYQAKPAKHVAVYKKRWPIEKVFRTTKGYLGLEDCYSTSLDTQLNHISSVLTAYAIAQVERKKQKLDCVEDAIRAFKSQNYSVIKSHIDRLDKIFEVIND